MPKTTDNYVTKNGNGNGSSSNTTFFIDGTNLCYWQDTTQPSINVLLELLYILKYHKEASFYCIFDANTHYKLPPDQREIYQKLLEHKEHFYQVTGGKKADDFILELADSYQAPVISNDNYNDPHYSKYRWKERDFTPKRLFMGEVIPLKGNIHLIMTDLDIHLKVNNDTESLYRNLAALLQKPQTKLRGRVKFFNAHENWGQLIYETDLYFQQPPGMNGIQDGYDIEFTIGTNERGPCAENISLVPNTNRRKTMVGVIDSYDDQKTFGYVRSIESNELLFFYKSYVGIIPTTGLQRGMPVEFTPGDNKNGKCAKEIRIIPDTEEVKQLRRRITELDNLLKVRDNTILQLKKMKMVVAPSDELPQQQQTVAADEQVLLTAAATNNPTKEQEKEKENDAAPPAPVKEVRQIQLRKNMQQTPVPVAENKQENDSDAPEKVSNKIDKADKADKTDKTTQPPTSDKQQDAVKETKKVGIPSPQQRRDLIQNRQKQPLPATQHRSEQSKPTVQVDADNEQTSALLEQNVAQQQQLPTSEHEQANTQLAQDLPATEEQTHTPPPITAAETTPPTQQAQHKGKNKAKGKGKNVVKDLPPATDAPVAEELTAAEQANSDTVAPHTETTTALPATTSEQPPAADDSSLLLAATDKQDTPPPADAALPKLPTPAKAKSSAKDKKSKLRDSLKEKIEQLVAEAEQAAPVAPVQPHTDTPPPLPVAKDIPVAATTTAATKSKNKKVSPAAVEKKVAVVAAPSDAPTAVEVAASSADEPPPATTTTAKDKKVVSKGSKKAPAETTTPAPDTDAEVAPPAAKPSSSKKATTKASTTTDTPAPKSTKTKAAATPKTATNSSKNDSVPPHAKVDYFNTPERRQMWWTQLDEQWKKAFNVVLEKGEQTALPADNELQNLLAIKRFSFHHATKNRLTYKLNNLQGLQHLSNITELNVSEHALTTTRELQNLDKLNYLGCSRNEISLLEGIDQLAELKQLYVAKNNLLGSEIIRVAQQVKLNLLDCRENPITDADKNAISQLDIKEIKY